MDHPRHSETAIHYLRWFVAMMADSILSNNGIVVWKIVSACTFCEQVHIVGYLLAPKNTIVAIELLIPLQTWYRHVGDDLQRTMNAKTMQGVVIHSQGPYPRLGMN